MMVVNGKLYFKQGIKTIFKNKFQLYVLLILAFLFSFILTAWLTVTWNLSGTYNAINNGYTKPDYVFSEKISTQDISIDQQRNQFIPLYDLISKNNESQTEYLAFFNGDESQTGVNFLLSNFGDDKNNTFITNTFMSDDFESVFSDFFDGSYGKDASTISWVNNSPTYKLLKDKNKLDPSNSFLSDRKDFGGVDEDNPYSTFISKTTMLLAQNYVSDLHAAEKKDTYLSNTLFAKYLMENKEIKDKFFDDNNFDENLSKNWEWWNDRKDLYTNNDEIIDAYFYNALETLPIIVINNLNIFLKKEFEQAASTLSYSSKSDFLNKFNNSFNGDQNPKLELGTSSSEEIKNKNAETSFEYLFGKSLKNNNLQNSKFSNDKLGDTKFNTGKNNFINEIFSQNNNFKGLYGYTNNFSFRESEDGIVTGINYDNEAYVYARVPLNKTFSSSIGGMNFDWDDTSYASKNIFSMRTFHFKLAAAISKINISLREEAFSFDPINKLNYRFVIVYDWNDIKIFNNKTPDDDSVYISQQYINNHKDKEKIIINGDDKIKVSGYASDPLSYLQFSDIDAPIIDSDDSCIVYLKKSKLKEIINNKDANGLIPNFSNNYFINGNEKSVTDFMNLTYWDNSGMNKTENIENKINSFTSTTWNYNFQYMEEVLNALVIVGLISIVTISFIILYIMILVISKCVVQNKRQIVNLKIQGANPSAISISYLGYTIVMLLTSYLFGYILGSVTQIEFVKWFSDYAVIEKLGINFNWKVLLILFFGSGGILFIANYLLTYFIIAKRTRIKAPKKLGINLKIKLNYKLKLRGVVIWKSKINIFILGITTFIATLLMSTFGYAMSSINRYVSESKQIINYNNGYIMNDPVANGPFSKRTLSSWSGFGNSQTLGSDLDQYIQTYYKSIGKYEDSVSNTSIIPDLIYDQNKGLEWTVQKVIEEDSFLSTIENIFINNATNINGKAFSIGSFEQFQNYLLHVQKNPKTGLEFNDGGSADPERIKQLKNFTTLFTTYIPIILKIFTGGSGDDIPDTGDWRELLLSIARQLLPNAFSKQYVTDTRKTQFYFEMNAENYDPTQDDLATSSTASIDNRNVNLTGILSGQKSFLLPPSASNIFINNKVINELPKRNITEDVRSNDGIEIYNKESKTLYIPVAVNNSQAKIFNTSSDVSFETNKFVLRNGTVIPNNAWAYLNYDVANVGEIKETKFNSNPNSKLINNDWLNINDLDTAKFNYYNSISGDHKLNPNAEFFVARELGADNKDVKNIIRPYYNYNNAMILIPSSKLKTISDLINIDNFDAANARILNIQGEDDYKNVLKNWYGTISSDLVPDFVKMAWENDDKDKEWYWVAPYNLNYDINFSQNNNGQVSLLDVLFSSLNTWMDDTINKKGGALSIKLVPQNIPNVDHIKFKTVAILNSYDHNLSLVDQKLLNFIKGYSDASAITIPLQKEEDGKSLRTYRSGDVDVDVYNLKKANDITTEQYDYNEWSSNGYIVPAWFNEKFSKADEPLNLTAGVSASLNNNAGIGMLFHDGISNLKPGYDSVNMEALKLKTIVGITRIALSIGLFVLTGIVIICTLVILILGDIFATQHNNLMTILKIQGYNKREIISIIMLPQFLVFGGSLILGFLLPLAYTQSILNIFQKIDTIIKVFINWYVVLGIMLLVIAIFALGSAITIRRATSSKIHLQHYS